MADTIFALSSGAVPSGVAMIRVSGPGTREIVETLAGKVPQPRKTMLAKLRDPETKDVLDEALVLYFEGPSSFTGEDVAEFQCHGGRAVVSSLLSVLSRFSNCRPAEAGEFTRRAFDRGRMDLTEVEGLADLIAAETESQRKQAVRQMGGALGKLYDDWRKRLIHMRAMIRQGSSRAALSIVAAWTSRKLRPGRSYRRRDREPAQAGSPSDGWSPRQTL